MRKQKFTEKRRPYKKYLSAKWNWSDVLEEIFELSKTCKQGYIKKISDKYGIVYNTLKDKYNKYLKEKTNINSENRGGTNKIFSKSEEQQIFNFLLENFIDIKKPLCNETIKIVAKNEYIKILTENLILAIIGVTILKNVGI